MRNELFSIANIFRAWRVFLSGKARKKDVVRFEYHLEDAIFLLHEEIVGGRYVHKTYEYFQIFDSKKRDIYKADVRDRVVHQIVYEYLTKVYEPLFIADSYSSRHNKGHHKAVETLRYFIRLASDGFYENCFVLKCDIKKYFDNIDHVVLLSIIKRDVTCPEICSMIEKIVESFDSEFAQGKGIPLGNVTSQIFANIYLHVLDLYVKKTLRCRWYVRYNDDFVIVSQNERELVELRRKIIDFVSTTLKLVIPMEKTSIRKISWGVDFLGHVLLPQALLLRNKTKGKLFSGISERNMHSYFGILKHCDSRNLKQKIGSFLASDDFFEQ